MTTGWAIFVVVLVLINVAGALWLLWWTSRRRGAPPASATTGHVWDDDLTEYNNALPRWWLWLFYLSVIFAAAYLVFYPGFGNFAGTLGWSQDRQHAGEAAAAAKRDSARFARFASMDIMALSREPQAMAMARNLFANNCTTCHGSDARGAPGFPNLADADWLYGGHPDTVYQTIAEGRQGAMPPWGEVLGASGTEEVIAYVLSISGQPVEKAWIGDGRRKFEQYCSACHGMEGRGNPLVGAPNLTDDIWLYGDSPEAIRTAIKQGRSNRMPAHLDLLGAQKVKLLAAYVMSLSPAPTSSTTAPVPEQVPATPAATAATKSAQ